MQDLRATYSPEDNKLRLYPLQRLPEDVYLKVKSAGFKWAPKQELFVAPMWTPEREDLLAHLCGDVEDEDTSLVDRAEERAGRFEDYSANRAQDAEQAYAGVKTIVDGIPFGQPILVGHHSEAHARRDAERIENGMRKSVKMWDQSKYWQDRARGAICHAKHKERPDVRARRIKGLEADKRKQERNRAQSERALKFWNGGFKLRNKATGETRPLEISEANREQICKFLGNDPDLGYLPCAQKEDGVNWDRWDACDVLKPDGERYTACPSWTVEQVQARALEFYPVQIAHYNRWISHYENRLTYERAMLAEDGGTVTDRQGPEVGGGVKCWASHRGCWSYVVKVNRVTVTVLDNWGNGGRNFQRNIPFDKISAVVSKAEVEAARAAGTLTETSDKTGFGYYRQTDSAPAAAAVPEAAAPSALPVEQMRDALKQGVQVVRAPQLFPTPKELAAQMVGLAEIQIGHTVLEPSAGTGNLAQAILSECQEIHLDCVEINPDLCRRLEAKKLEVYCGDFLTVAKPFCPETERGWDRIVMNPPFANAQDVTHIRHALGLLAPGGRLVAICANGPRQQAELRPLVEDSGGQWLDLPEDSFKESGTCVRAAMVVIDQQ